MKQYQGIIIGVFLAIGLSVIAFTEPAVAPPGGNVGAPINVSGTAQTKAGKLNIGGGLSYWITKVGDSFALENDSGLINFVVGQDGNVGIGTTNPNNALVIDKSGNDMPRISLNYSTASGFNSGLEFRNGGMFKGGLFIDQGTHDIRLWSVDSGGVPLPRLTVMSNTGNVGIGTTQPGFKLTVAGNVYASNQLIAGSDPSVLALDVNGIIQTKGARFFARGFDGAGNYIFTTGGAEPSSVFLGFNGTAGGSANSVTIAPRGNIGVHVTSSGDVGIGTTQPGFKLTVAGKIYSSVGVDGESLCIRGDCKTSWPAGGGAGATPWYFVVGGNGALYYKSGVGGSWTEVPGGCCVSTVGLSAARDSSNNIHVVARGGNGQAYRKIFYNDGSWSGWDNVADGSFPGVPAVETRN